MNCGLGRSSGGGHGNTLQDSCLESLMDRGACRATVHRSQESDTTERLSLSLWYLDSFCKNQRQKLICPGEPLRLRIRTVRGKEFTCNAGDLGLISRLGRSLAEGKCYTHQYSGLENSMDCVVHGVSKSWTRLSDFHFHFSLGLE